MVKGSSSSFNAAKEREHLLILFFPAPSWSRALNIGKVPITILLFGKWGPHTRCASGSWQEGVNQTGGITKEDQPMRHVRLGELSGGELLENGQNRNGMKS
jgi:hypothetical protein